MANQGIVLTPMKRSDDRPGRKQRRTTMTANNKIETASRDSAELGLDELMHVTGGGDTADAVAKFVGKVVGAALAYLEKHVRGPV